MFLVDGVDCAQFLKHCYKSMILFDFFLILIDKIPFQITCTTYNVLLPILLFQ